MDGSAQFKDTHVYTSPPTPNSDTFTCATSAFTHILHQSKYIYALFNKNYFGDQQEAYRYTQLFRLVPIYNCSINGIVCSMLYTAILYTSVIYVFIAPNQQFITIQLTSTEMYTVQLHLKWDTTRASRDRLPVRDWLLTPFPQLMALSPRNNPKVAFMLGSLVLFADMVQLLLWAVALIQLSVAKEPTINPNPTRVRISVRITNSFCRSSSAIIHTEWTFTLGKTR